MTTLLAVGLVCGLLLLLVTLRVLLGLLERASPAFRSWLDLHMPEHDRRGW